MDKISLKDLVYKVNGAAIEVHRTMGPGLLERVYHQCMKYELELRNVAYKSEMLVSIGYKELAIDTDLRCDLFIEDMLVVELKAVEKILPIHEAQLLTYMKLLDVPIGLMLNFNCVNLFKDGQKTYVNELYKLLD